MQSDAGRPRFDNKRPAGESPRNSLIAMAELPPRPFSAADTGPIETLYNAYNALPDPIICLRAKLGSHPSLEQRCDRGLRAPGRRSH